MGLPIQKQTLIFAILFAALMGLVLASGVRQFFVYKHYIGVLKVSESLVFQFSHVRDYINDSIIKKQPLKVDLLISELQELNSGITEVLDDVLIPDEYKLSFIGQVDISGIVILLRELSESNQTAFQEKVVHLSNKMRLVQERLVRFDRVMVNHARTQFVRFQNILIGGLAVIIFVIGIMFFLLNKRIIFPYLAFNQQLKDVTEGRQAEIEKNQQSREFTRIASIFNELINIKDCSAKEFARQERLLKAFKQVKKALSGAGDKNQLLTSVCRALLSNEDYCLVWIGEQGKNNSDIILVAADGCTTMNDSECQECMTVLLTFSEEQGLEFNPAAQALMKKRPVVFRDILDSVPKGLLKNTPLVKGATTCASFPLLNGENSLGVINIYSIKEDSFHEMEIDFLNILVSDVAKAVRALTFEEKSDEKISLLHSILSCVMDGADDMILTVDKDFHLIDLNKKALIKLGQNHEDIKGKNIFDVIFLDNDKKEEFKEALTNEIEQNFNTSLEIPGGFYHARVFPISYDRKYVFFRDITTEMAQMEMLKSSTGFASIGELSAGFAYEINNLVNGIINLAQAMLDGFEEEKGLEKEKLLLDKIVKEGEKIADIEAQILSFSEGAENEAGPVAVDHLIEKTISFLGYHIKKDAILLEMNIQEILPRLKGDSIDLQYIFLNLLTNAISSLNKKYPDVDENKRITIEAATDKLDNRPVVRISIIDQGIGLEEGIMDSLTEPFIYSRSISDNRRALKYVLSMSLIERNDGKIRLDSSKGEYTKVDVFIPAVS